MIWTTAFWKGAAERALKTFCQALVAVIGVGAVGLLEVDWLGALSAAALASVISLLTSIGNAEFTAGTQTVELSLDAQQVKTYVDTKMAELEASE